MKILILRPQPGADATAALARKIGIEPIILPLFRIEWLAWDAPDSTNYDAILLTSANAARAITSLAPALRDLPVHAVGPATAQAALEAGFVIASTGQSDTQSACMNAQAAGHHRLLWLAGVDHIALDPPTNGSLEIIHVYQSCRVVVDSAMNDAIKNCPVVALHSARAAKHFADLVRETKIDQSAIVLMALSPAIALAAGMGWRATYAAETPDDDALLRLADSYFTTTADTVS
jgi:uroporphyrinogen-III synthase